MDDDDFMMDFAMEQPDGAPDWAVTAAWIERHPSRAVELLDFTAALQIDAGRPEPPPPTQEEVDRFVARGMEALRRLLDDE